MDKEASMKARKFSQLSLVFFVICAVSQTAFAQQLRRLSDLQVPTGPPKSEQQRLRMPGSLREIENGTGRAIEQSNANGDSRRSFVDGTAELKRRQKERGERVSPQSTQNTIPYWSDSFSYQGLEFKYKMVGTDPKKGSKTTVIPTVIIPLRFVFPDGQVFDASTDLVDGQTPVQGIVNSPIFQNYSFVLNGTSVGTTQYGDAFQRANFWDSVSTRAQNYHVLLGQPVITATQTIDVPPGMASYDFDSFSGETVPVVEDSVLFDLIEPVLTNTGVTPDVLPIMVWGRVVGFNPLGFHGITTLKGNTQTLIGASYGPQTRFGGFGADTYPLSHEVIEWMDDPFIDNFTPGWNVPFILPRERCDSGSIVRGLLEVGDPVAFFHEAVVNLPGASYDYHVTEAMFIDFYTRSPRSRSVNGQYSMFTIGAPFGLPSEPSSPCIGSVQANERHIDVPGSFITFARGLNNQSDVVGYYVDPQNRTRGFLWKDGTFADINFPQASATLPFKINDSGEIVGYFFDGSGRQHGFSYAHGQWTRIDYPGARATVALGLNSAGLIVGA